MVPNPGGVLIRDAGNHVLGAVGISGDTGENDEIIAVCRHRGGGTESRSGRDEEVIDTRHAP